MKVISESDGPRLKVGFKQVQRALAEDKAAKVYLASDCDEKISVSIACMCREKEISLFYVDTMTELGKDCGIDVKASCAVVTV